jgi:superfamily I DNA/RNA helicase
VLLGEALARVPDDRWDALVVDEGQDFRPQWWGPTLGALQSPGDSVLYVFWDPNQDIYGGGPPDSLGLFPLVLDHNCRNTVHIGSYAARVLGVEPRFRDGTPEGDTVTEHAVATDAEVGPYLAAVVELLQSRQGIATERMVVLSTRSLRRSPTLASGSIGDYRLVPLEHGRTGPRQLRSSTVHRFKGLEEDVVLLVRDATDDTDQARRLHHVGASRARHLLVVVHVGAAAN